jgi:hypothetical protein
MRKSIGFLAWIGLVEFPTITDYWCKSFVVPNGMRRKRFELLLQMWHFPNNEEYPPNFH